MPAKIHELKPRAVELVILAQADPATANGGNQSGGSRGGDLSAFNATAYAE